MRTIEMLRTKTAYSNNNISKANGDIFYFSTHKEDVDIYTLVLVQMKV